VTLARALTTLCGQRRPVTADAICARLSLPAEEALAVQNDVARHHLLPAGLAAQHRIGLQRGLIGGARRNVRWQRTDGRATGDAVAADKGRDSGLIFFTVNKLKSFNL
jgi:hypothetical protein